MKLTVVAVVLSCAHGFRVTPKKKASPDEDAAPSLVDMGAEAAAGEGVLANGSAEEQWLGRRRKQNGIAGGAACAGKMRQCGGKSWTGTTCCQEGLYCKRSNAWYSQCRKAKGNTSPTPTPASSSGGAFKQIGGNLGSGKTTRYWDCCKPSCSWGGKASVSKPVGTCAKNGVTKLSNQNAKSVCDGGDSYMCNSNQPWYDAATKMSYGFAATHISGGSESSWCCACYQLSVSGGKKIVVQVTNTGGDLGSNHFDIQIPGGGFGIFDGCTKQWGARTSAWGDRYGGVMKSGIGCSKMPSALKASCQWLYDHWGDNPSITSFHRVKCPAALTAKSGCKRSDE